MQKLITFKTIKLICCWSDADTHISGSTTWYCDHEENKGELLCRAKNCPIWKHLKSVEKSRASELLEEENKQLHYQLQQYVSSNKQLFARVDKLVRENDRIKKRVDMLDNVNH
jgi:hypothetical protein